MRDCACMHMSTSLPCDVVNRRAIRADFRARKWPGSTFERGACLAYEFGTIATRSCERPAHEVARPTRAVANAQLTGSRGRHGRAQPSNLRSRAPNARNGSRPTCRFRIVQHAEQKWSNLRVENRPTCILKTVQLAGSPGCSPYHARAKPTNGWPETMQDCSLRRLLPLHAPDAKNGGEKVPRLMVNQSLIGRPR